MSNAGCGTISGYRTHRTGGTVPCLPCTDAWRDYTADWRVRTGRVTNAQVSYTLLGLLLTWVPDFVLRQAEEEIGKPMVQRAIDARHRSQSR